MKLLSATRIPSLDHESYYRSIASESYIAVSLSGGIIYVLCSRTGSLLQKKPYVEENTQLIGGLVLDGDNLIFSTSQSPIIRVYNILTETILSTLTCPDNQGVPILERLKSSKDECIVAAVHFNGEISILKISTQTCLRTIKVHDELAHFFTQLNDSKFATSLPDGTFAVSDWETGEVRWKKKIGEAERKINGKWVGTGVFAQTFWEEEGRIVVGTKDGRILVLDVENGTQLAQWQASSGMTQHLQVRGHWLFQVSWGEMKLWSTNSYHLLCSKQLFDRVATAVEIIDGVVICCGRDAAAEDDRCGLVPGFKGWYFPASGEGTGKGEENPGMRQEEREGGVQTTRFGEEFKIGTLARRSDGLARLEGNRIMVCVLRDVWYVEIWEV